MASIGDFSPPLSPPQKAGMMMQVRKQNNDFSDQIDSIGVGAHSPMITSPTSAKGRTKSIGMTEASEPLNLLNLNSLGEPKASAIGKHDLLSAINFDCAGDILSVGVRGGRVILFERIENE